MNKYETYGEMSKCEIYVEANETETWGKPNMTDNDLAQADGAEPVYHLSNVEKNILWKVLKKSVVNIKPDLADSGNMWQLKYQEAHRELVVANRAVQRLSARCKKLRVEYKKLRGSVALTRENVDDAFTAYQHDGKMVYKLFPQFQTPKWQNEGDIKICKP